MSLDLALLAPSVVGLLAGGGLYLFAKKLRARTRASILAARPPEEPSLPFESIVVSDVRTIAERSLTNKWFGGGRTRPEDIAADVPTKTSAS